MDVDNKLTVKLAVEMFTGFNGEVEFVFASSVPLSEISGVPVTLIAGTAAPVVEILPE